MDKTERIKDLLGNLLQARHIKVHLLLNLTVVLRILIQVVSEKLSHDKEMFFVVEKVDDFE